MKREENYTVLMAVGLVLTIIAILAFAVYSFGESSRLVKAAEEFSAERVSLGSEIYQAQCVTCHGAQGEGGVGFVLNSKTLLNNTPDEVFFSLIRSGVPNTQMPAWSVDFGGPLTDEDVRNVVAFIRAWEPTAPVIEPVTFEPSPERGAVLFATTCSICHGENGKGGKEAPAINDAARLANLDANWYRQVIKNGRPAKGMPTWGTVLAPAQVDDLVALIDSWREGKTVQASFDITELLNAAIFSLQNEDAASAKLQISRAKMVAPVSAAEILSNAEAQLEADDPTGALKTLEILQAQWPMGDPANGSVIYSERCAVCHGTEGQGGVGKVLKPNEYIQGQKNADLIAFLLVGRPGTAMAGFKGRLADNELADVVTFLRSWQP